MHLILYAQIPAAAGVLVDARCQCQQCKSQSLLDNLGHINLKPYEPYDPHLQQQAELVVEDLCRRLHRGSQLQTLGHITHPP